MRLGKALIVAYHEKLPALRGSRRHGLAVLYIRGHRLFAQDVLPCSERFYRQLRVGVVCSAHAHSVDRGVCQQLLRRVVHLAAILCRHVLRALSRRVIECRQLTVRIFRVLRDMPHLRDLPAAQYSYTDHKSVPPYNSCSARGESSPRA